MSSGVEHTHVWLARYYKVDANPVRSQRKICTCIVISTRYKSLGVITYALDDILHKVKYFSSKELDWNFIEKRGGYHLHVIGRINVDGTVTKCETPITDVSSLDLMNSDDMVKAFSEVYKYTEDPVWLTGMRNFQHKSPLEEKYDLPGKSA